MKFAASDLPSPKASHEVNFSQIKKQYLVVWCLATQQKGLDAYASRVWERPSKAFRDSPDLARTLIVRHGHLIIFARLVMSVTEFILGSKGQV